MDIIYRHVVITNYFKIKYVKLTLLIYRNLKVTKIQASNWLTYLCTIL